MRANVFVGALLCFEGLHQRLGNSPLCASFSALILGRAAQRALQKRGLLLCLSLADSSAIKGHLSSPFPPTGPGPSLTHVSKASQELPPSEK